MMERFTFFFIVVLTASLSITTVHNLPYQFLEFSVYPYEYANDVASPSNALPDKPYYGPIGEDNGQYVSDVHRNVIKPIDVQTNHENSDNNYPIDSQKDDIIKINLDDDSLLIDFPLYDDRFYVPPEEPNIEPTAFEDNGSHRNISQYVDTNTNPDDSDRKDQDASSKTNQDNSILIKFPVHDGTHPDRFYVPPEEPIIEPTAFEDNGSHRNISQYVDTNTNPDDSDRKDQDASSKTDEDDLFSTNSPSLDDSQPNNSEQTLLEKLFLKTFEDDKDLPDKDVHRQVTHVDANVKPDNSAQSDQFDSPEKDSSKNDDDDSIQIPFEQHDDSQPTSFWGSLWDKVSSFFTSGWNYVCRLFT